MIRVGLVACAASKLDHPAPAAELYTSTLFRKASAYAAATCDAWYVLSARHGLVRPGDVLEPYDERLVNTAATREARAAWGRRVRLELELELLPTTGLEVTLVALAGELYREHLYPLDMPVIAPLRGLGIGQQLGYLSTALRKLELEGAA